MNRTSMSSATASLLTRHPCFGPATPTSGFYTVTCRRMIARSTTASSSSWRRLNKVDRSSLESLFLLWKVLISSSLCTSGSRASLTASLYLSRKVQNKIENKQLKANDRLRPLANCQQLQLLAAIQKKCLCVEKIRKCNH